MSTRTIRVRGSAEVSAAPDWVTITFNVSSSDYEYGKCLEKLEEQTEKLREELIGVGLEKESLKTIRFNIDTDFERFKNRREFKGYRALHDLKVSFPFERDYLNQVLGVLSYTKSQASFNIYFGIKETEPLRQQAIAEAVKNSQEKAEVLAEAAGVNLGEIMQIDYSWSEIRFESSLRVDSICESSSASYDFTPEDVDVSESVNVVWSIY